MKKTIIPLVISVMTAFQACKSTLYLSTSVDPQESLVIGDSVHSAFEAKLVNLSGADLNLYQRQGTEMSNEKTLKSGDRMLVKVNKGSEIVISNKSQKKAKIRANIKTADNSSVKNRTEVIY